MRKITSGPAKGLSTTGKPIRALRALEDTTADVPMDEQSVYRDTYRLSQDKVLWYYPLDILTSRGLARRVGPRGGFSWYITEAGREVLRGLS